MGMGNSVHPRNFSVTTKLLGKERSGGMGDREKTSTQVCSMPKSHNTNKSHSEKNSRLGRVEVTFCHLIPELFQGSQTVIFLIYDRVKTSIFFPHGVF